MIYFLTFILILTFIFMIPASWVYATSGRAGMLGFTARKLNFPPAVHQTLFLFTVDEHAEQRRANHDPEHIRQGIVDIGGAPGHEVLVKFIQNPVNTP